MFRAQLRLVAAFLVLGIVATAATGMYYAWKTHLEPSYQARQEILELESEPPKRIDRGNQEFAEAMDLMAQRDIPAAHKKLSFLVSTYKDSAAFDEARRILGEINMDRLLSKFRTPGKIDYEIQGGDSLIRIANNMQTTVDYIVQVNDLTGDVLRRGERLIISALDFEVMVVLSEMTVTLLRHGKVFKQYPIRISRGVRPADAKVESKSAFDGNARRRFGQEGYIESEKWITANKISLGPYTRVTREDEDVYGIFLDVADIEELYTILRIGTPIRVRS